MLSETNCPLKDIILLIKQLRDVMSLFMMSVFYLKFACLQITALLDVCPQNGARSLTLGV